LSKKVCATCGQCCKGDNAPAVSLNELKGLPNPKYKKISEDLFRLNAPCQYLAEDGCTLKNKPIACELYPFYPVKGGGTSHKEIEIGWLVKTSCPHWYEFKELDLLIAQLAFEEKRNEFKDL